jgi:hypothetical protein
MDEKDNSIANDGGFKSRKFLFALYSSIAMIVASRIVPAAGLSEVITGLIAVCAIYITGSAVIKWRAGGVEQAKNALDATAKSDAIVANAVVAEAKVVAKDKAEEKCQPVEAVDDMRG